MDIRNENLPLFNIPLRQQIKLRFFKEEFNNNELTQMYTPDYVRALSNGAEQYERSDWEKPGFEMKDWINHFLSILNRSKVSRLVFAFENAINLESLHNVVKDVNDIYIQDTCPEGLIDQIVRNFNTAKQLTLECANHLILKNIPKQLCLSYDVLKLYSFRDIPPRWDLDDLLIMNSRSIRLLYSNFSDKHFNGFLRHWIEGSNPRMEHFGLCFPVGRNYEPNTETILKGLNYVIAPNQRQRVFTTSDEYGYGLRTVTVKGGYDIQRNDGTTGTIIIRNHRRNQSYNLEFFVWLD